MRKIYQYDELAFSVKGEAIKALQYINVPEDWNQKILDQFEGLGLYVRDYTPETLDLDFTRAPLDIAANIQNTFDRNAAICTSAEDFMDAYTEVVDIFLASVRDDMRNILDTNYHARTAPKAIEKSIREQEYEFTEDGIPVACIIVTE